MEMRMARVLGMSGLLLVGALGCNKVSKDNSKVLASVGGEKITEVYFAETVRSLVGDEAKSKDLLGNEAMKEERNQLLNGLATQKALILFAKAEGIDKDPKIKIAVDQAIANAYAQAMIERRLSKGEPTEAQLKAIYDDYVTQSKASGAGAPPPPPFAQVKDQLVPLWKRQQGKVASDTLLTQLKQKYPVTFAPDYKPAQAR